MEKKRKEKKRRKKSLKNLKQIKEIRKKNPKKYNCLPDSEVQFLTGWVVHFKDMIWGEPCPVTFPH